MRYARPAWLVFLLLAFANAYFLRAVPNANVNSRLSLIFAVVQDGGLAIDSYVEQHHLATSDVAQHNGHLYSEKALGTALLGVPVYWLMYQADSLLRLGLHFYVFRYVITLLVVALPVAFAGSLFYLVCERVTGDRWRSFLITLGLGLGTMLWPFSTLLFGHALAAAVLWMGFYLVFRLRHDPPAPSRAAACGIGLLLGFAVISEFSVGPIAVALGVYYLCALRERGALRADLVVACPAAALLAITIQLAYNWACFGSPFSLGYEQLASPVFQEFHQKGFLGVSWPRPIVLYYLTLHPVRGLFVQSPLLLASLAGSVWMWKQRRWRAELVLAVFALLSLLWINAGFGVWWGGWTFGPRHLVPALFFLGLPLAFLPRRALWVAWPLALLSIVQMLIPTAGDPLAPDRLFGDLVQGRAPYEVIPFFGTSPIYGWCLERLSGWGFRGFTPNAGMLFGLQRYWSLAPLFAVVLAGAAYFRRRWAREPLSEAN